MENRVLTLEELIALDTGAPIYVETSPELPSEMALSSPWHTRDYREGAPVLTSTAIPWHHLPLTGRTFYGEIWRVWLREPTPAELSANPWP